MKNQTTIEAIYPLSPQQQGMLFETLFAAESGIFIEQDAFTWPFPIDSSKFRQAWQRIVDRHAILRTAFVWKEQDAPLQVVLRRVEVAVEEEDWRSLPLAVQQERLERYLAGVRRQGFDVARPPLMRLALFRLRDTVYQFVWSQHHILMDGWCRPLIFKEFETFYRALYFGQEPSLEEPRPYRDYIRWLQEQDLSAAEVFWREKLRGFSRPTPLGRPAEPIPLEGERYGRLEARLGAAETLTLQNLSRQHRLTLSTLLHGAWALLLSRYSGDEEVIFGTTVSGRPASLPGVESIIGLFINTLPFRVRIRPKANWWDWLGELQAQHLECREYEHCSAGQIHGWSQFPGSLPLYESLMVFENYPSGTPPGAASAARPAGRDGTAWQGTGAQTNHALTILAGSGSELLVGFVYDARRLDREGAANLRDHYLALLRSVAGDPQQPLWRLLAQVDEAQIPLFHSLAHERSEAQAFVAPRTPAEELLAGIWRELLKVEQVGIHANFFELGGHSLLAMQLASRIREAFQVDFPLRRLFEAPTLEDLAFTIEEILLEEIEALDDADVEKLSGGAG